MYTNEPSTCNFGVDSASPALGTISPGFDNYIAVTRAGTAAAVQSDEQPNDKGPINSKPGYQALSFNLDSGTMYITSLFIPLESFNHSGHQFVNGTALLQSSGVVTASDQGNSTYAIPAGQTFRLMALDQNADGYTVMAQNSTPLTISLADSLGPQISGSLNGQLDGHPVHATLNAALTWINRPPVAAGTITNVSFNSSSWEGAQDVTQTCGTATGVMHWTWHGVPGAKVNVKLDASPSYNPDGGDLQYAWNLVPLGAEKVAYLSVPAGNYSALLTVQNQYYVSTVNKISFKVQDLANPGAPSECGSKIATYDPHEVIKRIDLKDPVPFRTVVIDYATNSGPGIAVNGHSQTRVTELASALGDGVGPALYNNATMPGLTVSVAQVQNQSRRLPLIIGIVAAIVMVSIAIYLFVRSR